MSNSLISVVMPTHNNQNTIKEAINSILSQTYKNFEFIIINDGSIDDTEKIIKSFKDKRIKYLENKTNKGISFSLNKGIKTAEGKYIARMDADDISLPQRLKIQIAFMEKNKNIGVCGSWASTQNSKKIWKTPITNKKIKTHLLFNSPFIHPSIMIRASLLEETNYPNFKHSEDYGLWALLADKTDFYNLSKPLIMYKKSSKDTNYSKLQKKQVKKIRKIVSENLGLNLTKHQIKELNKLGNWESVESYKDLNQKQKFIKSLFLLSSNNSKIDKTELNKICVNRWHSTLENSINLDKIKACFLFPKMTISMIINKLSCKR